MFIHSVYFWLREELSEEEVRRFEEALGAMSTISSVRERFVGKPGPTDRPIIDRTYTHALILAFDDVPGHDHYQVDPVHDWFRENFSDFWRDIKIYDVVTP